MFVSLICYLERQRVDGGAVDTSVSGRSINEEPRGRSSIHFPAALRATTSFLQSFEILFHHKKKEKNTFVRMQVPNRPIGAFGYSVRNYAPPSLYPQYQGSQCPLTTKPPSGKSFTIDALLAKPERASSCRASPTPCGEKYQPGVPVLPLTGHAGLPMAAAPYGYSQNMLHSALHAQPGYSVYCCPPFTYQSSCRGAFYAHGKHYLLFPGSKCQNETVCTWQCD